MKALERELKGLKESIKEDILDDIETTNPKDDVERFLVDECGYRRRLDATYIRDVHVIPIIIRKDDYAFQDTNMIVFQGCVQGLSVNIVNQFGNRAIVCGMAEYLGSDELHIYVGLRIFTHPDLTRSDFLAKYDFTIMEHELSTGGRGGMRRSIVIGKPDEIHDVKLKQRRLDHLKS